MKVLHIIIAVAFSLVLAGCGDSEQLSEQLKKALTTSADVAARNKELAATNAELSNALSAERKKAATLATELEQAKATIVAEREAKWRARNEVAGARKVAESSVAAAHAVGVKQVKPKP